MIKFKVFSGKSSEYSGFLKLSVSCKSETFLSSGYCPKKNRPRNYRNGFQIKSFSPDQFFRLPKMRSK